MTRPLQLHPASHCGAKIAVSIEAKRPKPGLLTLAYTVAGDIGRLYVPPRSELLRTNNLWKRTCFEAFLLPGPGDAYVEFNLAPSGRWATYRFDRYREGMRDAADVVPSPIAVSVDDDRLALAVSAALPELAGAPVWRLGLTAVIEEASGHVSYWALAHPRPQPEFHDAAGFVLELSA